MDKKSRRNQKQLNLLDLFKKLFIFDKDKIHKANEFFRYDYQINIPEQKIDRDLEQKVQAEKNKWVNEISQFWICQVPYIRHPSVNVRYKYKTTLFHSKFYVNTRAPVEEQVALEKATERLNPLQPLKPIKPNWEPDIIKKVFQNIAEFFGLTDIYRPKSNNFYSVSYSLVYSPDENYNQEID